MKYYVYILLNEKIKNWSYVGSTSNLEQRVKDHNRGKTKSTKRFKPLKIIYQELCETMEIAHQRELYFKSGRGREERYKIINNYRSGVV